MIEEKRSKYDTDPLDPDFVRRTEEMSGGAATGDVVARNGSEARPPGLTEEPTRRFDEPLPPSYPSVFVPPVYQPPRQNTYTTYGATGAPSTGSSPALPPPSSRPLPKLGIPENVALALPYAPFYIGAIIAAVELFLLPRNEVRTRFHASQGLALHLAIFAGGVLFRLASTLVGLTMGGSALLSLVWTLFWLAAVIYPTVLMVRMWKGREPRLDQLADATKWLNRQIEPRK